MHQDTRKNRDDEDETAATTPRPTVAITHIEVCDPKAALLLGVDAASWRRLAVSIGTIIPTPTVTVTGSTAKNPNDVTVTIQETGAVQNTRSTPGWSVNFGRLPAGTYHVQACATGEGCTAWVPFTVP